MSKEVLRRALGVAAALTLTAGMAITAAPAQASERPLDFTGYKVSDITVADSNCRNLTVNASANVADDYVAASGSIDVTKQGGIVASMWFEDDELDRAYICPSLYGLGTYMVGPANVFAEYEYYDDYFEEYNTKYTSYTDYTSKTFHVRGKSKSTLSAKRYGAKVKLTAKATVYKPEKYRYAQYNASGAKFQVKSGSKWKTLKTVNLKKGQASITVKQSKKKSYRLQIPTATWAASTTSKSVSK